MNTFHYNVILKLFFISLLFISSASGATYNYSELLIINWGEENNQLKIEPEVRESVYTSDDGWIYDTSPSIGPNQGFVDRNENIYFASYGFEQLKGFDSLGRLIFDYSKGTPGYNPDFYNSGLYKFYVDSLSNIYVIGGLIQDYISVIDTAGHLLNQISPLGVGSGLAVTNMFFNSDDVLSLKMKDGTNYTYVNGSFLAGGCSAWRAKDGYYYYGKNRDTTLIVLKRFESPTIDGVAAEISQHTIIMDGPYIWYSEFMGVDDQMRLYLYVSEYAPDIDKVLVLDSNWNTIDEVILPFTINIYHHSMRPFMRPSDGNIYEFRVLDDGLHVIRWSKQ